MASLPSHGCGTAFRVCLALRLGGEILPSTGECSLATLSSGQFCSGFKKCWGRDISLARNKLILFELLV